MIHVSSSVTSSWFEGRKAESAGGGLTLSSYYRSLYSLAKFDNPTEIIWNTAGGKIGFNFSCLRHEAVILLPLSPLSIPPILTIG